MASGNRKSTVFLTMGSSIRPENYLPHALRLLKQHVEVMRVSPVYGTAPVEDTRRPRFLNAAVLVHTGLTPRQLKYGVLRRIEASLGRVRSKDKNAPRTIDIDIALFGDVISFQPKRGLVIPYPEIVRRVHVALPLADLDPDRRHPLTGQTLAEIAAALESDERVTEVPVSLEA